jgi:hypothetical protein
VQLYAGPAHHFIQDALQNAVAEKLRQAFQEHYRYAPPPSEVNAWRNSLRSMSQVLHHGELQKTSVLLEYQLPLSSRRLDCMVMGTDASDQPHAVIVELKQWEDARPCDVDDCVLSFVGGAEREVLHPSAQVHQYRTYLEDMHTAFQEPEAIGLDACAYLHNWQWSRGSAILDPRYEARLGEAPVYFGDQAGDLIDHLRERVLQGDDGGLIDRVAGGKLRASRGLMQHVADVIEDNPVYTLLDEQLVVFNTTLAMVQRGYHGTGKAVVLIHGGPGTGKSVIAANLVARLNRLGYQTHHATGSRAFTENLRKAVGGRARALFGYFNNFTTAAADGIDVLICDEAHRIREHSHSRFTPKAKRSERAQVDELVDSARVSVFFIDDLQVVRPGEVGSGDLIRDAAERAGARLKEFELDIQFRCQGSEAFVSWIDNTLGIRRTADVLWNQKDAFDFRIIPTVEELEAEIRQLDAAGHPARLVAGFCWPWSKRLDDSGQLEKDVKIGDWERPWNARPEMTGLPRGVPKSNFWATDPNGIEQVGCVYTAQGFEFDCVGVIMGKDLVYDPARADWVGQPSESGDHVVRRAKDGFLDLVKHVYRVLFTRGMKGCYVTFLDRDTEAFFRSRLDSGPSKRDKATGARSRRGELRVADVRSEAGRDAAPELHLTKNGRRIHAILTDHLQKSARTMPARPDETWIEVANDLGHLLDRPDLARWRQDATLKAHLRDSLERVLRGASSQVDWADVIDRIVEAAR